MTNLTNDQDSHDGQRHLISVVDADPSARKALVRLVQSAGYNAVGYETAEQFLKASVCVSTDCLILDVQLPGKSGLDLLEELTASGVTIPTVFLTADDSASTSTQAMQSGAVGILSKPLEVERLLEVITKAIAADET